MSSAMMPCTQVIHRLWDYLDEEVSPGLAAAIRAHLEDCGDCRAVTAFEESFLRTLRTYLDDAPPDHELRAQVVAALEGHGYRHPRA